MTLRVSLPYCVNTSSIVRASQSGAAPDVQFADIPSLNRPLHNPSVHPHQISVASAIAQKIYGYVSYAVMSAVEGIKAAMQRNIGRKRLIITHSR